MSSKAKVNMNLCGYQTTIEVTVAENGGYHVKIISPCPKVRKFAEGLEHLDIMDITDWSGSKILDRMKDGEVGLHCSVPTAVLNVARLEAGMIAMSMAKKVKGNSWEFVFD
ncbi:MAG TPA: hypothetical protein VGK23_00470 [Methanomassiliicoccales archaeon]|jgi:hypothetical protein